MAEELALAELLGAYLFEGEDFPGAEVDEQAVGAALREAADAAEAEQRAVPTQKPPADEAMPSPTP
eukprot:14810038-Alexandrium_andersonii.AAC.1